MKEKNKVDYKESKRTEIEISDDDQDDDDLNIPSLHPFEKQSSDMIDERTTIESSSKRLNLGRRNSPNNFTMTADSSEIDIKAVLSLAKKRFLNND